MDVHLERGTGGGHGREESGNPKERPSQLDYKMSERFRCRLFRARQGSRDADGMI